MARETYVVEATARTDTSQLERKLANMDASVRRVAGVEFDFESPTHTTLEPGDTVVDDNGPTPSAEKNTVVVTEVLDERVDEHYIDTDNGETDDGYVEQETVYKYNNGRYPASDPVVRGYYKFLNSDKIYSFPASRLRDV